MEDKRIALADDRRLGIWGLGETDRGPPRRVDAMAGRVGIGECMVGEGFGMRAGGFANGGGGVAWRAGE